MTQLTQTHRDAEAKIEEQFESAVQLLSRKRHEQLEMLDLVHIVYMYLHI